jgi:VCBS repeat-containing protein
VTAVNDAPIANAQSVTTDEDTSKDITLKGTDSEGNSLIYSIVARPSHGTLSIGTAPNLIYTPNTDYAGTDSFTFKVNDGTVDSATATVSISVTAVNDAPIASAQSVTTDEDTPKDITLKGTDREGDSLTYSIVARPSHGTLTTGTAANLTYTPTADYAGTDSFIFKVYDGKVDSATAMVSITVTPLADLSVADVKVIEGNAGTSTLTFTLTLNEFINSASVYYATTDDTATANNDYIAKTGIVNFTGGNKEKTISITIKGDINIETDETFTLNLFDSSNLKLSNSRATGTITNDDFKQPLNDTGITRGGDYPIGNNAGCTGTQISAQDCYHGRDVQTALTKIGAGAAGFDFTKLNASGVALAYQTVSWNRSGSEATNSRWSCVKDNVTGLTWEVKTDVGFSDKGTNIHHKDNTYQWGGISALGKKVSTLGTYYKDWDTLVKGSNRAKLCGYNDWRVPTAVELQSIVHYGIVKPSPKIDKKYFPNTVPSRYWSSLPHSDKRNIAWSVNFSDGIDVDRLNSRSESHSVRLVR